MSLEVINGDYYAVGAHNIKYCKKASRNIAQDVRDIFDSTVEKTECESLVLSRIGQGKFRQNVIEAWGNGERCALTLTPVREILIASHIVPWSKCSNNEQRLDGANGILLCAHVDKLFDAHLLTFVKQGSKFISKLSPKIDATVLKGLGIESGHELGMSGLSHFQRDRFEDYIAVHNREFEMRRNQ